MDTRILLHAKDALDQGFQRIIMEYKDTDVMVIAVGLLASVGEPDKEIWMKTGTFQKRKFVPIHEIQLQPDVKKNIAFYALTGCDSTSQFSGKGKKRARKIFLEHPHLLDRLGE